MTTGYKHQKLGWLAEVDGYAEDPFDAASNTWYRLGKYNTPWGDFPTEDRTLSQLFTGASQRAQDTYFHEYMAQAGLSVSAVNGLPLYWALGNVSHLSTSDPFLRIFRGRDIGDDLPSICPRTEDTDDDTDDNKIYEHYPGMYVQNLTTSIDFSSDLPFLVYLMQLTGTQITSPSFSGVMDTDPVYPGGVSDHYMRDSNFACLWDIDLETSGDYEGTNAGTGTDIDIKNEIMSYSLVIDNALIPDRPQDQEYPDDYFKLIQSFLLNFSLLRDGDNTYKIYDDFITMQDNETTRNMHFAIYQDATHYLQIDLKNVSIGKVTRGNTAGTNRLPTFDVQCMAEDVAVTEGSSIDDRDNDHLYGDRSS